MIKPFFSFLLILIFLSACTNKPKPERISHPIQVKGICPAADTLKPPQTILLSSRPGPVNVQIPEKAPATPAGFYIPMTKYTTEQGLALNVVSAGMKDRNGNLWFGTVGGGVSRYDGKAFTNFTTIQGLADNYITTIYEDRGGNIWLATLEGGVSRYDGKVFTNFTTAQGLPDNMVWNVLEDQKGIFWFATQNGVCRYDPQAGGGKKAFTTYTTAQGLSSNVVRTVLEGKNGCLWFGTGKGVCCCNSRLTKDSIAFSVVDGLQKGFVAAAIEDHAGNFWFGTYKNGVYRYEPLATGGIVTNLTTHQGLSDDFVMNIKEDRNGLLWFGTFNGGVCCYDPRAAEKGHAERLFTAITKAQGFASNRVFCTTEDRNGNLWFGIQGGLYMCEGKTITGFGTAQGLSNGVVWSILQDKRGNYWFGTDGGGVIRYDPAETSITDTISHTGCFRNSLSWQGLSGKIIYSMAEDKKGNLWFGTREYGVTRYVPPADPKAKGGGTFSTFTTRQGLPNDIVDCITEDTRGKLWLGTRGGGVSCYTPREALSSAVGKSAKEEPGSFTNISVAQGLPSDKVKCIYEDSRGYMWFGLDGGGLTRYDPFQDTTKKRGSCMTNFNTDQGLASNVVWNILEDKNGNLWIATSNGISRYDGKSFLTYTTEQGLSDNYVYVLRMDQEGNIVLGTEAGITLLKGFRSLSPGKNSLPETKRISASNLLSNEELMSYVPDLGILNFKTGYPLKSINTNALFFDKEGVLWAGVEEDLVRLDLKNIPKNKDTMAVCILNVKINDQNISWYKQLPEEPLKTGSKVVPPNVNEEICKFGHVLSREKSDSLQKEFGDIRFDGVSPFYFLPEHLVLPYRNNYVTFDFTAIEPAKPYVVRYQYMLEGYGKSWSPVTEKTSATFGNIPEGSYTFRVKARSLSGVWSQPVSYTFQVLPPWYRTWWSYSIYALLLISAIGGFINYRLRTLRQEKEILELKVEDRTKQLKIQQTKILDSINYAKHIQKAILKEEEHITPHLPAHFVLFKPKDIVSGDFYWSHEKEGYWYIAAVDCTGHGVPGAFLSMLGVAFLNEISSASGLLSPAEILDRLRSKIMKAFCPAEGSASEIKDGMDVSLARIDLRTREIQWAGAYNSLLILKPEGIHEIKADRQPIGFYGDPHPFTNHIISIHAGESIYLFTDGYADQQSPQKVRITRKMLKEVILSIGHKSMEEQKGELDTYLLNWKGKGEQTDDICLIGIRLQ
jgi:ligand-binding sensor domain-containing protein/serine phosphatase RsbU (regulator of sigma subunit)